MVRALFDDHMMVTAITHCLPPGIRQKSWNALEMFFGLTSYSQHLLPTPQTCFFCILSHSGYQKCHPSHTPGWHPPLSPHLFQPFSETCQFKLSEIPESLPSPPSLCHYSLRPRCLRPPPHWASYPAPLCRQGDNFETQITTCYSLLKIPPVYPHNLGNRVKLLALSLSTRPLQVASLGCPHRMAASGFLCGRLLTWQLRSLEKGSRNCFWKGQNWHSATLAMDYWPQQISPDSRGDVDPTS